MQCRRRVGRGINVKNHVDGKIRFATKTDVDTSGSANSRHRFHCIIMLQSGGRRTGQQLEDLINQ